MLVALKSIKIKPKETKYLSCQIQSVDLLTMRKICWSKMLFLAQLAMDIAHQLDSIFPQPFFRAVVGYTRDEVKMKLTFLSCPLESVWVFVRASFACSLRFPRCICRVLDSSTRSWTSSSRRGPRLRNRHLPLHPLILKVEVTHQIQI